MTRIRTIKPEFWMDEKIAPLDPQIRLVFLGLIGMADDFGRLIDNAKIIDAFIFPFSDETSREALETLSRLDRIRRGKATCGQSIIQIVNWSRHQKVDRPNRRSALPEIVDPAEVNGIRDSIASESRDVRDTLATHTTDHRPPTYIPPTTDQGQADLGSVGGGDRFALGEERRTELAEVANRIHGVMFPEGRGDTREDREMIFRVAILQVLGLLPESVFEGTLAAFKEESDVKKPANFLRRVLQTRSETACIDKGLIGRVQIPPWVLEMISASRA